MPVVSGISVLTRMGKGDRRRISARLGDDMQELTVDLNSFSVRSRGPRLLMLATIGLAVLKGNGALLTVPNSNTVDSSKSKEPTTTRRSKIPPGVAGSLLDSAAKITRAP